MTWQSKQAKVTSNQNQPALLQWHVVPRWSFRYFQVRKSKTQRDNAKKAQRYIVFLVNEMNIARVEMELNTSTILPLGRPPPNARSKGRQPLGNVSLQQAKVVGKMNYNSN